MGILPWPPWTHLNQSMSSLSFLREASRKAILRAKTDRGSHVQKLLYKTHV